MSFTRQTITIPARTFIVSSWQDLEDDERSLFQASFDARQHASPPYSKFYVGAAIRTVTGNTYQGCNVEFCSYSQTIHAEQNAIGAMVRAEGACGLSAVAVFGGVRRATPRLEIRDDDPTPLAQAIQEAVKPCGHCRQILWEFCLGNPNVKVMCLCFTGHILITDIGTLYPMPFGPVDLDIDYSKI